MWHVFRNPIVPPLMYVSIHYSYSHCFNLARGQKIVFKGRPYKSYKLQTCETAHFDSWKIVAESFLHILMKKASYQQNTLWADSWWGFRLVYKARKTNYRVDFFYSINITNKYVRNKHLLGGLIAFSCLLILTYLWKIMVRKCQTSIL